MLVKNPPTMNQSKNHISYQCINCGLFQNSDSYVCSTCKFDSSDYYVKGKLTVYNSVHKNDRHDNRVKNRWQVRLKLFFN